MMPSNGPPTPKGVGGPTPPLVSRVSEEEGGERKTTEGLPSSGREGKPTSPSRCEEEASPSEQKRGERIWNQKGVEEPPPTHRGREGLILPQRGEYDQREGRGENREENGDSQQQRPERSTRRTHTSRELRMLDPSDKLPPKRARWPTRGMTTDDLCEATRDSNMICPITCGCHNSLLGIGEKTRIVSQILRSTRKIWKNELIAIFGLTAAFTNKTEILELKHAQEKRNSDLYPTSIQYTVLGNIHGKEVYLVPPQDAALLLQDRISLRLRSQLKQHNAIEGVGQFANHTCCDAHWNANLEVAAVEHYEETTSEPMGILRARKDIEPDTEILTRYWHTKKDAWHNIFVCQCCACTNHTEQAPDPLPIVNTTALGDTLSISDHLPREREDPVAETCESKQDDSAGNIPEYPDSEIDDWNWDELEAFPFKGVTIPIHPQKNTSPLMSKDGTNSGPTCEENPNHVAATLHTVSHAPPGSILEGIALTPQQSFPEMGPITAGTPVTIYTGGHAHIWKVSHTWPNSSTSVTIKHKNCVITVDKNWLTFDIEVGTLVLQRLGFFNDPILKCTTNSFEIWRNILNPDKMMDGDTLTVLLEWTIHGSPRNDTLGLPMAQSKTWLVDRSFWQSWEQNNEPLPVPWECKEWVCIDREPLWGTVITHIDFIF